MQIFAVSGFTSYFNTTNYYTLPYTTPSKHIKFNWHNAKHLSHSPSKQKDPNLLTSIDATKCPPISPELMQIELYLPLLPGTGQGYLLSK